MPIIYLSPSTQDWNYYVNGGTEEEWMNLLADKMVPMLDASGIRYAKDFCNLSEYFASILSGARRRISYRAFWSGG